MNHTKYKIKMLKIRLLLVLASLSIGMNAAPLKEPLRLKLDKNWQFTQADKNEWMPAKVCGTVHQDLIDNGKLINPFFGMNEEKVQWVEKEDWKYRTTFTVSEAQLGHSAALLRFEGLDTYADIYLNGALLKRTDNMFVGYDLQVKDFLRKGDNHLTIYFHSPIKQALPQWETDGFPYPADNDHSQQRVSIYTRKAPYSYGWDWGIRLATSGIWRPVTLTFYDAARIEDLYVEQLAVNNTVAKLNHHLEISRPEPTAESAEVTLTYTFLNEVK